MIFQNRYKPGDVWHDYLRGPSVIISIVDVSKRHVSKRHDCIHVIVMIVYSPCGKDPVRTVSIITKLSPGELSVRL